MPLYEYECARCHRVHEVNQKISDPRLTDCSACGEAGHGTLSKLMSAHSGRVAGGGPAEACPPAGCGRCADPPGACAMN